jgi:large subunit ribosomal protein L4
MIEIPVLDTKGQKIGAEQLDPARLGDRVRYELLKQAVVAYRANKRQGTVATKSRGMVDGSTRKLYRQKGTGRARAGNLRTPVRVGGGHAFAKINRDFSLKLPRKMRRLARDSAILAKALSGTALIVSGIKMDAPKTAQLAGILRATQADGGAILAMATEDRNLLLSGRNIPNLGMKLVSELNAYDVLRARKLVFTPEAFKALTAEPKKTEVSREA